MMPLYLLKQGGMARLIYASTPQGAKNHVLKEMRESLEVSAPTPLEVATLVSEHGLKVEQASTGMTLPPEKPQPEPVAIEEGETPEPFVADAPTAEEAPPWNEPDDKPVVNEDLPMEFRS